MGRKNARVLLVDDDVRSAELLGSVLDSHGFVVTLASSVRSALVELKQGTFDGVVMDMLFDGMPEGPQVLAAARELHPQAAVIVMTGYPAVEGAVSALKGGAVDYLTKPVDPAEIVGCLQRSLRERELACADLEFTELAEIVSNLVANTIERIDPYTAGHGQRTREYCAVLADRVGLDPTSRERLQVAAIAHDYGKIYLEDRGFLTKPGPLSASEYQSVKQHPALGAAKLGSHPRLREVCRYVAEHHERWDGNGYPNRLKGEEISLPGRILCVVEVFDSLATRRSYKDPWPLEQVLDFFHERREKNFDPDVTDAFLSCLAMHGSEWIAAPQADAVG